MDDMTSVMLVNGKYFDFANPDMFVLDIETIAHHLALTNRFCGATEKPYSVAQHSYYVSVLCDPEDTPEGLFHDKPEALINDIPRPAKGLLPCYKEMEEDLLRRWYDHIGIRWPKGGMSPSVHEADMRICLTEARDLMPDSMAWKDWSIDNVPYEFTVRPWPWKVAKRVFIDRAKELGFG